MSLAKIKLADRILHKNIDGWGKKRLYVINLEESFILLEAGAKLIKTINNGDGTFLSKLKYEKKTFVYSTGDEKDTKTIKRMAMR